MGPKGGNYVDQKLRNTNRRDINQRRSKDNHRQNTNQNRRNNNTCRKPKDIHKCVICDQYHALRSCRKFLKMDVVKRMRLIKDQHHCINCLARSHTLRSCTSTETCKKCDAFHHTLLHPTRRRSITTTQLRNRQRQRQQQQSSKQRSKKQPAKEPQASSTPDTKILSEAIKSLAMVLCASGQS